MKFDLALTAATVVLVVVATPALAMRNKCIFHEHGQWCGNNQEGECYFPAKGQSCCPPKKAGFAPSVCRAEQHCVYGSNGSDYPWGMCCDVDKAGCVNHALMDLECIDPNEYACCPTDVQKATDHAKCALNCENMHSSVCTSSWGKARNCSFSQQLGICYNVNKFNKCSTSLSSALCTASQTCCKTTQDATFCCNPGHQCVPELGQGCVPKHKTCIDYFNKSSCTAASSDCAWCNGCYNKTAGVVNECCEAKSSSSEGTSAQCTAEKPFCCNAGDSATCCGSYSGTCCANYMGGANVSSTSSCTHQPECCPKHIQLKYNLLGCTKRCTGINIQSLCQDSTWNPNCTWDTTAGICYETSNPPCPTSSNTTICSGAGGVIECCRNGDQCLGAAGCVPKNANCAYFNGGTACSAVPNCYGCPGGDCVNTTAGQCCSSATCGDGSCCLNNPSGCCGLHRNTSVCCLYDNSRCCQKSDGAGFCCRQDQTCGADGSCKNMTSSWSVDDVRRRRHH